MPARKALDLFMIYQFLRRLVKPFNKWEAYKLGVIDRNGKVLIDKKDRTKQQKDAWGYYDRLLANLKKLLAKVPGGRSRLASFAAALLLLREQNLDPEDTEYLAECLDHYMVEANQLLTEENVSAGTTNVAGSGKVAGIGVGPQGDPPVMTALQRRRKKKKKKKTDEEWSEKYKRSIDCSNPKGFSQKAYCAGQKKKKDAGND